MSKEIITKLTPQQEELLLVIREKWLNLLKQPIDQEKVSKIINKIYQDGKRATPEIIFTDSPESAYHLLEDRKKNNKVIGQQIRTLLNKEIEQNLQQQTERKLRSKLEAELRSRLRHYLWDRMHDQFWRLLMDQMNKQFGKSRPEMHFDLMDFCFACYFDFLQQIGIDFEPEYYDRYIDFLQNVSLYLAFENLVIIIQRPTELNWNQVGNLHAEEEPAIKFRDGFGVYAYDGALLPPKYGRLPLDQWASNWLTKKGDSELIPYIEKWRKICFSTERINPEQIVEPIREIYKIMDYPEPEILFFDSPGAVIKKMDSDEQFSEDIGKSLATKFCEEFMDIFSNDLRNQLGNIWLKLGDEISIFPYSFNDLSLKSEGKLCNITYCKQSLIIDDFLETKMHLLWTYEESEDYEDSEEDEDEDEEDCDEDFFSYKQNNQMHAVLGCNTVIRNFTTLLDIDFCILELKCNMDLQKWSAFKELMTHCGSVWFYENACIICDRPSKISFDSRGRLHGEGISAIEFTDGFSVYAFNNIWLPEKYGKVHPSQWKSQWLLEDNSADITEVLIQNIGYKRISYELNQYPLTPQDQYELLRINLYDKIDLTNSITFSQKQVINYIDLKSLPSYEFEIITVDFKGEIIAKEKKQAEVFTEDLGNNVSLEMVVIPGGEFMMGTAGSEGEDGPQHRVKVSPFLISKYPITQAQWWAVASMPKIKLDLEPEPSYFQGDIRPVERVDKQEVIEFCARLWQYTGRLHYLPSEAQWEYACRGNTTNSFYFGETITTDLANYNGEELCESEPLGIFRRETLPVGSFSPNAFGLYDMHGNVFELCADNWHEDYQDAPDNDKSRIGGNDECISIRGGGWESHPWYCKSANRSDEFPRFDRRFSDVGFRVVLI